MKNIAKTAHHHEETPHDNALQNVKKGEPQIRNYAPNMIQK